MTDPAIPTPEAAAKQYADTARREYRLLRRLTLFALIWGCAECFAVARVAPELLERRPSSVANAGQPPLAGRVLAAGVQATGLHGMLLLKCLWGMALVGLIVQAAVRSGVRPLTAGLFSLLVAVNLQWTFSVGPQLVGYMCCGGVLLLLDRAFRDWRRPFRTIRCPRLPAGPAIEWTPLTLVPLILIIWANSGGGLVAGVLLVVAYLLGRALEMLIDRRPGDGRRVVGLTAILAACALATIATPSGLPPHDLAGWMSRESFAWSPHLITDPRFWPFAALVIVNAAAWSLADAQRDLVKVTIIALLTLGAARSPATLPILAIASGFWTLPQWQCLLRSLRNTAARGLEITRPTPLLKWAAIALLLLTIGLQTRGLTQKLMAAPTADLARAALDQRWSAAAAPLLGPTLPLAQTAAPKKTKSRGRAVAAAATKTQSGA